MTGELIWLGIFVALTIVVFIVGAYMEHQDRVEQERKALEVRRRAVEAKLRLDAEAFRAAARIQDAVRRGEGRR